MPSHTTSWTLQSSETFSFPHLHLAYYVWPSTFYMIHAKPSCRSSQPLYLQKETVYFYEINEKNYECVC